MMRAAETTHVSQAKRGSRAAMHLSGYLAFCLLVFLCCVRQSAPPDPLTVIPGEVIRLDNAHFSIISDDTGAAMVDFFSAFCGACSFSDSVVAHIAVRFSGRALVGKVEVGEEEALKNRFAITELPTFIFFNAGREVRRAVGIANEDSLAGILENLINAKKTNQ